MPRKKEKTIPAGAKKRLRRTLALWTLVSLVLQFGFYTAANYAVVKLMEPSQYLRAVTVSLEAVIPDSRPDNIQISYAKDYLAYMADGYFKVFNLKQNKAVFVKGPTSPKDNSLGVLNYHWLPDRNTLIYFYAQKNPNPYTTVKVSPAPSSSPANQSTMRQEDPTRPGPEEQGTPAKPREVRIYNPQLTELYTLELPGSSENTLPDNRLNLALPDFPAGGKIKQIATSTYTNMIYLTVSSGSSVKLMEIDIMNDTRMLQRSGETILAIAASDHYGTLYVESQTGNSKQILALDGTQRRVVAENEDYAILGDCAGKLYLGEIKQGHLVRILAGKDSSNKKDRIQPASIWQGDIPFSNKLVGIDSEGKIVVFGGGSAYIIRNGRLESKTIGGGEYYLSSDGAELIQLTRQDHQTKVKLKPF